MNTTKQTTCRKIEPIIIKDSTGWTTTQECGTCGRAIEATANGWRHIDIRPVR